MKKTLFQTLMVAVSLVAVSAFAADTSPSSPGSGRKEDKAMEAYRAAAERKDWPAAAAAMKDGLSREADNADFHSLYAYSLRKGPNPDMSEVFKHYNEALRIDPKHKGAHEYLGEAYLMTGNVEKAREHLGQLDKLCFFTCSEFTDLKKAIAEYEAKKK